MGRGRAMRFWPSKQAVEDTQVTVARGQWYENDDTPGHRKLVALFRTGKNRVRRVRGKTNTSPELDPQSLTAVVFSGIFVCIETDGTRHRLRFASVYHAPTCNVPSASVHSDHGKPFGAAQTRRLLLAKGFQFSISRAGTPTDKGDAQMFVSVCAVAEHCRSQRLGAILPTAHGWVQFSRSHGTREDLSPDHYVQAHGVPAAPFVPL